MVLKYNCRKNTRQDQRLLRRVFTKIKSKKITSRITRYIFEALLLVTAGYIKEVITNVYKMIS